MKLSRNLIGLIGVLLLAYGVEGNTKSQYTLLTDKFGDRYGYIATKKPGPLAIVFTTTIADSLNGEFTSIGTKLSKAGFVVASIDLPCHGENMPGKAGRSLKLKRTPHAGDSLKCWASYVDGSVNDFFAPFFQRASHLITDMNARKLITSGRIVVIGVSRGGYLALRAAALDPRITDVIALAPVTDLRRLQEFSSVKVDQSLYGLDQFAPQLAHRRLFLQIGIADSRVGTHEVLHLVSSIAASGNGTAIDLTLSVTPGFGHVTAEHDRAADWAVSKSGSLSMRAGSSPPAPQ